MDLWESVLAPAELHSAPRWSLVDRQSPIAARSTTPSLMSLLVPFTPISLAQMNHVALLDRAETKYFLHRQVLPQLLKTLRADYDLLVVASERASTYRTLYYDTADFALYHSHHAGALNRYKVRAREYVDSAVSFLEVKHKTNKKRTVKYRLPTAHFTTTLAESASAATTTFLQEACPFPVQTLQPVLWNRYRRVTLVSKSGPERLTIDVDLRFSWQAKERALPQLVIAEVKQDGRKQQSPFIELMRAAHIHSNGFSKYCMGVTLLYPTVKANRFKKKKRAIAKLLQNPTGNSHSEALSAIPYQQNLLNERGIPDV